MDEPGDIDVPSEWDVLDRVDEFLRASVFMPRSGDDAPPGIVLSGSPSSPCVCVFSTLELLAEAVAKRPGTPATWLSTTGADLFAMLPHGCGVVVDALAASPVFLSYDDIAVGVAGGGESRGV